jgi:hypothetical protein
MLTFARPREVSPNDAVLGVKTVLYIRVDFSDLSGDPLDQSFDNLGYLTKAIAESVVNTSCSAFMVTNSYNQLSLSATATPLLRMPHVSTYYVGSSAGDTLRSDALAVAAASGFNYTGYDYYLAACRIRPFL